MKRITRQIRIETSWHLKLKVFAAEHGMTIVKLIEQICEWYFANNDKDKGRIPIAAPRRENDER
jgi:predicted DNA-binding ribbon-helix-helix protein